MKALLNICCGLDVHKESIVACILKGMYDEDVTAIKKSFSTMRGDIYKLRDWLNENDCKHVAMESTGVYWKPIYEILEEAGDFTIYLVNAQHMKNIPGRKTDVKDAEWIAELFCCGLLENSFIPTKEVRELREYARYYKKINEDKAHQITRIEKFLQTHGLKLSSVISDIVGVSGKKILYRLAEEGSITSLEVSALISKRVKKSPEEIAYALNGSLSVNERKLLKKMLIFLETLERELEDIKNLIFEVAEPFKESIELLVKIPGLDVLSSLYVLGEIGDNMDSFPSAAHISSWAGLSPRNNESAGKKKSQKIMPGNRYIKSILCQCAWAAIKTRNTRLSRWFWSHQGKIGQKKAIIAVARKLLVYIYNILKTKAPYDSTLDCVVKSSG